MNFNTLNIFNGFYKFLFDKSIYLILIIFLITFPYTNETFQPGLDAPLIWIFNYFFYKHPASFPEIAFPYGPLAFLMFPMFKNALWAGLFHLIIVIFLWKGIENILKFKYSSNINRNTFILCLISFLTLNILNVILLITLIYLYLWLISNFSVINYIVAVSYSIILFYIKISSGVTAFAFITGVFIFLIYKKKFKTLFFSFLISILFYIGIGTLLFGNPLKPIHFFLSSYFVSTGNNDIAIYNHDNFFFMLTPSILLILIFYLSDDPLKNLWIFILLFPLFIEFKHGFTRKDTSHIHDLIMFYSEILMFYFIVQKSINVIKILIGILIPFLTHINIKDTFNSENFGIFPLRNNVFLLNNTSKNHDHFSIRQQMHNIQSDSILFKKMKGKTADVFPWDQTILLSNQTKWIPRPSILMNSNQFCDSINKIFVIKDTPFFYLMHKIPNFDGIQYSSLDDKYLFNNEPEFTNTLLEYYTTDTSTYNYLLLKKRFTKRKLTKKTLSEFNVFPYKFYKIPECAEDEILKLSLSLKINLKEKLLSALYKPNPIWIKLFTKENIILIFRCSLYSLQKGIWLHPLLYRENIVLHPTYFSFQTIGFSSGEAKFTTYRFSDSLKEYFFSEKKYSSITLIKSITGQLNKSIYYPISDSFLEDTLLISTDYPEYSFKIKFDTLPKFNAFCSINLPLFLNELKDLKEIKIVLYKKGISHLPFPIKELSMANYYKKDMSVQHIQLLLNPWEIDYNAEYSLHLINLPNAKISLLPLKINFYDFVN